MKKASEVALVFLGVSLDLEIIPVEETYRIGKYNPRSKQPRTLQLELNSLFERDHIFYISLGFG